MTSNQMIPANCAVIDEEEIKAVARVLRMGRISQSDGNGPSVLRMERIFALYTGTKYAVATNSGTSALTCALLASSIGRDNEVVVPTYVPIGTLEAVHMVGAKPVFADIDPKTYCIETKSLKESVTDRTKAIIAVHLFGLPADMAPIAEISADNSLVLIEDGSDALGAEYEGRQVGCVGDLAFFSFREDGMITTGEGGMVTTDNSEYMENLKSLRCHGDAGYRQRIEGFNFKMTEIEASIGIVQLSKLPGFLETRRRNASILSEILQESNRLLLPEEPVGRRHCWYVYTAKIRGANAGKRNKAVQRLRDKRVWAEVYYPRPLHATPFYAAQYGKYELPNADKASRQTLSLPVHPALDEDAMGYVAKMTLKATEDA